MLKIAYSEASFDNLRNSKELYIDKTAFIPRLERVKKFFFIRPRRFGKSLWISVLQAYYDINKKGILSRWLSKIFNTFSQRVERILT